MGLDWVSLFKRYVWNEYTTPYLTRVPRLSQFQARKELFAYSVFVTVLFAVFSLITFSLSGTPGRGLPAWMAVYALSLAAAGVAVGKTRGLWSALYCLPAPLAAYVFIMYGAVKAPSGSLDRVFIGVLAVLWLAYAFRVIAICRAYPGLSDKQPPTLTKAGFPPDKPDPPASG